MVAAEFWIEEAAPRRPDWVQLAVGLGLGLILGGAVVAFAGERLPAAQPEATAPRTWSHPALDRQWRGTRTPVQVERMFPKRRR